MAGGAGPETGTELERVVEALELLLRPPAGPGERDAVAGPGPELRPETLRSNAAALAERLRLEPGWAALRGLRDAVLARSPALAAGAAAEAEPGWAVACGLLALLLCLRERLAALAAVPAARGPGPGAAPPPSADTLSVAQGRSVARALRAAVGLGLLPYLPPGVGQRPGPPASPSVLPAICGARLLTATTALTEVARHPALGSPLLARHLGLLLASLCLLGHGPTAHSQGVPEAERAWCREALRDILDRVYQPLAVRELLVLQGRPKQSPLSPGEETKPALVRAPAWLRRLCGQLLSERLMRPSGVQSVVRGIMEGTGGGAGAEAAAVDWRKCDMVAKILASCPQQCLSLEDYYRLVCPQILDLLHIQDKLTARQFQRVATTTLLTMVKEHPQLAQKYLLQPLLAPLLRCSETAELAVEDLSAGSVLVTEAELSSCVEDVLKVYVVGNDSSSLLLQSLQSVLGVVFSLYSFAKQNVSYLRSPCQEILLWFLEKSERDVSLSVLEGFAGLNSSVHVLHPRCRFCAGSEGGATIAVEETVSDEDEALYQKISSEQRHVEDLVELLSHCQKSGLAGDFFICCLKALTHVAAEDEVTSNSDVEPGRSLLELEQYHAGQRRKLQVLQLVATLCESVSDTVFTDVAQVEAFVAATLQRACVSSARGPGTAAEAQTLAMAMGLVAAMLGGAVQLQSSDFAVLKRLVPLLEELSRTYPDPLTQELAADLRIAICTHGAFSPATVGAAADGVLGKKPGMGMQSPAGIPGRPPGPGSGPTLPQHSRSSPSAPRERSEEQSMCHEPGAVGPAPAPCADSPAPAGLQEILVSAYDPQPPGRAAALRHLASLITQRDPEALQLQEKLLQVFLENLQHEDAFVYLSAIQGRCLHTQDDTGIWSNGRNGRSRYTGLRGREVPLPWPKAILVLPGPRLPLGVALLSSEYPERILPVLLARYRCPAQGTEDTMAAITRMKLGEVLMRVIQALAEARPVGACSQSSPRRGKAAADVPAAGAAARGSLVTGWVLCSPASRGRADLLLQSPGHPGLGLPWGLCHMLATQLAGALLRGTATTVTSPGHGGTPELDWHPTEASAPWARLCHSAAGMGTGHPTGQQSHHLPVSSSKWCEQWQSLLVSEGPWVMSVRPALALLGAAAAPRWGSLGSCPRHGWQWDGGHGLRCSSPCSPWCLCRRQQLWHVPARLHIYRINRMKLFLLQSFRI
ncbi:transport and Golgi organization protein 6 homolog isoform X2 [Falco biarmicus]|uniref:transport and Golgi organization protein 6 homolog isoform X2 n=1 Tax=Falco biarmicus TaxID=345155 RepID=UPI0024BD476B|nr:transport and Golgi organization protein 6 homolog isoform X2 [Falco biarmicus]